MTIQLPPNAYGERTEDLQKIISDAEGMRLFTRPAVASEQGSVARWVEAHLAALRNSGGAVPALAGVRLVGGAPGDLDALWSTSGSWRDAVGVVIGELNKRHGGTGAPRLGPPIWPAGAINVFGVVVVATEEGAMRCAGMCAAAEERDTCWEILCFAEKIVDAALVAALFRDRSADVFSPLLSLMRAGLMPAGYDGEFFTCVESGVDRNGTAEKHLFVP